MRKIYISIVMVFFTGILFAQKFTEGNKIILKEKIEFNSSPKTISDTLIPSGIANATSFCVLKSIGYGYVTGNNSYGDISKAQQFFVNSSYCLEGVLIWFGVKSVVGVEDILRIVVWDMDGTTGYTAAGNNRPCPNTELISVNVGMNSIDTGYSYHSTIFPTPIGVFSDFAVGINVQQIGNDTIGIIQSNDGSPTYLDLSWEQCSNGQWQSFMSASSWGYDIDLAIFPLVDMASGLVDENNFINGIKMSQNQPNPATNNTLIFYEIEKAAYVKINIVDITGKVVITINKGFQNAGIYNTTIETNNLSAGTYFYMLQAGNNRLAKRMIIQ